ncbi:GNAT family N-acetyltransferase [Streptomyces sp. NPDC008150]|uniref:GNAT family N-acetyltransferase n=1 Tax=Streptomyces sp. NPDC008150 TaxID=3364816 RepID=UPI0036E3D094
MVAVRTDDGRYAGSVSVLADTGEMGGWLASPRPRSGPGHGTVLGRAGAELGHFHLGLPTVRAGFEPANLASAGALAAVGFVPADAPPRHTLGDGREVGARWSQHTAPWRPPCRCAGPGSAASTGESASSPAAAGV